MTERIQEDPDKTMPLTTERAPSSPRPLGPVERDLNEVIEGVQANEAAVAERVKERLKDVYPDPIEHITVSKVRQDTNGKIIWAQGKVRFGNRPRGSAEESFEIEM